MKILQEAISYCDLDLQHEDLIQELTSDNDIKKQLCIIEIKKLSSQTQANLLVGNLTGKSGPIREVTSFKILDLIENEQFTSYFQTKDIIDILTKAITDINPAVSRNTVEIIKYISDSNYLINNIIKEINETLRQIPDIKQNRSYALNKKNFNIYWNLEALINLSDKINITDDIVEIVNLTAESKDYTIREKTAKLICALGAENFPVCSELLQNDEIIYVSKYFN